MTFSFSASSKQERHRLSVPLWSKYKLFLPLVCKSKNYIPVLTLGFMYSLTKNLCQDFTVTFKKKKCKQAAWTWGNNFSCPLRVMHTHSHWNIPVFLKSLLCVDCVWENSTNCDSCCLHSCTSSVFVFCYHHFSLQSQWFLTTMKLSIAICLS